MKPPIIWGDVSRPEPMTVSWSVYAQSLTDHPMKGMLTGPVTILNWSFPREDISVKESTYQIALAIRDEVLDLEAMVFTSSKLTKLLFVKNFLFVNLIGIANILIGQFLPSV